MYSIDGIIFSLQNHGGISVYFSELLKLLTEENEEHRLLIESSIRPINLSQLPTKYIDSRQARWAERYRSCRLDKPTTVFHSSYYRKSNRANIPTVMTVYDFVYERYIGGVKRYVHSIQKNSAIRSAQSVICISQATKDDLLHYVGEIPGQSVHVIHCGVSKVFRPLELEPPKKPYMLFVGQRGGYKNFRLAVAALELLPDMEMVCVGGGSLQRTELDGSSSKTHERIRHAGYVDNEGLNRLYNQAACLVYPSSYEGFGIPVIEAMRAGCPVVSLNCDAVVEVGKDALTIAEEHDAKAVADSVNKTRSSARGQIISRGFEISSQYSWQEAHRQTLEVYRSLS